MPPSSEIWDEVDQLRESLIDLISHHSNNYIISQSNIVAMKSNSSNTIKPADSLTISADNGAELDAILISRSDELKSEHYKCVFTATGYPNFDKEGYTVDEVIVCIVPRED